MRDPSQLGKIMDEAPETIIARLRDPIPTPDGRWLRVYALADGSVQQKSTEDRMKLSTGIGTRDN